MTDFQALPLGIDIGSARTRVALTTRDGQGRASLVAVAVRPSTEDPATAIIEAIRELETKERRCVFGVSPPDGILRMMTFPPMRNRERERAARFEATRFIDYSLHDAAVRVDAIESAGRNFAVGILRKSVIARYQAAAKAAQLQVLAIDDSGFALARVFPGSDAILDIGMTGSVLHLFGRRLPKTHRFTTGGRAFTDAIASSLGIEFSEAEHRKTTIGIIGTGELLRDAFIDSIASEIIDFRAAGTGDVRSITLVGNGARLPNLADDIEAATAIPTTLAMFGPELSRTLPSDVLRAAAPDWSCAVGLSTWVLGE